MRDLAVLAFLLGCMGAALWRPWLGVLSLAVFSYMNPHAYAWGFMRSFPAYQALFIVFFLAFFTTRDKQKLPRDWRVPAFFLLWLYFVFTTTVAMVPDAAWEKLIFVSKIYLPFIFTLWLINSREKLYYLIAAIAGSIGLVAAKGGLWAIAKGFEYRVYGPDGTQFGGNNEFAIATLMAIPLLILCIRETSSKVVKYALIAVIPLCLAAAVSSHSRGALLTIAVVLSLLVWHSKRKYLAIPLLLAGVYLAVGELPEHWFARMETITTYAEDASARGRLEVWRDGLDYALEHPFTGAGFEGWMYVTTRDWHSSHIEILAEHGFIAFGLWASLLFGTLFSLTTLPRRTRGLPGMEWVANYSYMLRASLVAYAVGTAFLGLSYWDIFYHLVFISVLLKRFALEELAAKTHQEELRTPAPGIAAPAIRPGPFSRISR